MKDLSLSEQELPALKDDPEGVIDEILEQSDIEGLTGEDVEVEEAVGACWKRSLG